MTARIPATSQKLHEARPQSWLRSFLERRLLLLGGEDLKHLRVFAFVAWILGLAPRSLLASRLDARCSFQIRAIWRNTVALRVELLTMRRRRSIRRHAPR